MNARTQFSIDTMRRIEALDFGGYLMVTADADSFRSHGAFLAAVRSLASQVTRKSGRTARFLTRNQTFHGGIYGSFVYRLPEGIS